MKGILRRFVFYTTALFLSSLLLSGLIIHGGVTTYVIGGIVLSLMMLLLKPILSILSFPLNMITFGFFSIVVNGIILFLLTIFVPQIAVHPFAIPHLSLFGFSTPMIALNKWLAFLVASLVISGVYSLVSWLSAE